MEKNHVLKPVKRPVEIEGTEYQEKLECVNCGEMIDRGFALTQYDLVGPCMQ